MKVLVACEFTGIVRDAFIERVHDAMSCDILSAESPGPHYEGDVFDVIDDGWDMIIAHPPCTRLANSGVRHLYKYGRKENGFDQSKIEEMIEGCRFFRKFVLWAKLTGIPTCIENPIMHKYAKEEIFRSVENGKPSQIIHPWMFGHMEQKATCLWLYNLPKLVETDNVYNEMMKLDYKDRAKVHCASPGKDRAKIRSKTYTGVAKAMAEQWGCEEIFLNEIPFNSG